MFVPSGNVEFEVVEQKEEYVPKFEEFLRLYYWEELKRVVERYPKEKSVVVDFQKLEEFDYKLADELLENPDVLLDAMNAALSRLGIPGWEEGMEIKIRIKNLPADRTLLVRNITSEYIGKLIQVEGIVRQITTVLPKVKVAVWMCKYCKRTQTIVQEGPTLQKPFQCVCGKKDFVLLPDQSKWIDFQKIQIQEPLEYLKGGEQARYLDIFLEGDLVNKVVPGDRVVIVGILRLSKPSGQKTVYGKYLEALYLEPLQKEFEELEPTPEEVEEIKKLASDPNIYEKLVRSIAPSIKGHEKIKEAIALQLFGGVKKELPDGTKIRGNIHVLLMGDPGTGKSQLLMYATKIAPKSFYVAGKTASGAGLTASAERDEFSGEGWVLKAGVLVLASGGLAAIDEFEKIDPKDRAALHEAMEQQQISVAKAGIVTRFKAETSILAAANPKFGRFDPNENPLTQINIEPTILSRFDLMFIIRDVLDKKTDAEVAEHILKTHKAGEMRMQYEKGETELTIKEVEKAEEIVKPEIDIDLLRKYVAYARTHVFPVLTEEAMEEIKNFFVNFRALGKQKGTVPATARQLEALIRLAEASARVRLSQYVTREDAQRAIDLFKASLEQVLLDQSTGLPDIDIIVTGQTRTKREQIKLVLNIIRTECQEQDMVALDDIIELAKEYGIERDDVKEIVERLKRDGSIYEPRPGFFRPAEM